MALTPVRLNPKTAYSDSTFWTRVQLDPAGKPDVLVFAARIGGLALNTVISASKEWWLEIPAGAAGALVVEVQADIEPWTVVPGGFNRLGPRPAGIIARFNPYSRSASPLEKSRSGGRGR